MGFHSVFHLRLPTILVGVDGDMRLEMLAMHGFGVPFKVLDASSVDRPERWRSIQWLTLASRSERSWRLFFEPLEHVDPPFCLLG